MRLPEYISLDEVQRVCSELQIRDWTQLREAVVQLEEAEKIQREVGAEHDVAAVGVGGDLGRVVVDPDREVHQAAAAAELVARCGAEVTAFVFVINLANDFLKHIFHRDDACHRPVFINHDKEMLASIKKIDQNPV